MQLGTTGKINIVNLQLIFIRNFNVFVYLLHVVRGQKDKGRGHSAFVFEN